MKQQTIISNDGADYAEYFESASGQAIPAGTPVTFTPDGKIKPADGLFEVPFGVVSKMSAVVGNAYEDYWHGKYERDEFGNYVYEQIKIKPGEEELRRVYEEKIAKLEADESIWWRYVCDKEAELNAIRGEFETRMYELGEEISFRKKISADWKDDQFYIPRSSRSEWCLVGLIGQIPLIRGARTHQNWMKIRDLSNRAELWLVK